MATFYCINTVMVKSIDKTSPHPELRTCSCIFPSELKMLQVMNMILTFIVHYPTSHLLNLKLCALLLQLLRSSIMIMYHLPFTNQEPFYGRGP